MVDPFKKAESKPLYKKDGRIEKLNFRPLIVLFSISKIYERCLHEQIYYYFDKMFSKYQSGCHEDNDTQLVLLLQNFT